LQLTHGGTFIVIEFATEESTDFFPATQIGLDLIEDFFAAVHNPNEPDEPVFS